MRGVPATEQIRRGQNDAFVLGGHDVEGLREHAAVADEAGLPHFEGLQPMQVEQGADIAILDPAALAARFPWLNLEGIAGGSFGLSNDCLLYTSPSPRDRTRSRMPSSA